MAPKNSQQAVSPPLDIFVEDPELIEEAWDKDNTPYDYVIVGSGAGGGPLAARLALAGKRVLVVEAGGDPKHAPPSPAFPGSDPGDVNQIPGFHAAATEDPEMSWQFSVRHYADNERQAKDHKYNQICLDPNRPPQQPDKPLDSKYLDAPAGQPGRGKRGILYPRSSGIGGCTGHHAMIMATPNDRDWNGIADLTGDDSWRAEKMRGYFARLERCLYPAAYDNFFQNLLGVIYKVLRWVVLLFHPRGALDNGGHGFNGWQPTSFIDPDLVQTIVKKDKTFFNVLARTALSVLHDDQPLIAMFKRALFRLRIVQQLDPNDLNTRRLNERGGVFLIPLGIATQNTEKRCPDETDEAFRKRIAEQRMVFGRRAGVREFLLKAKAEKPNHLVIAQGYQVTRVIFAPAKADSAPRAIGIAAVKGKNLYEASPLQQSEVKPDSENEVKFFTRGEVILCGGAFNTPQLLMLSGIGNKAHLQEISQRAGDRNACTLTAEGGDPLLDQDKKPQRIHLPGVGKNLQDRYEVTVIGEVEKDFSTLAGVSFVPGDPNDPERRQWLQEKNGLYATNGGTLAVLQRSKRAGEDHPDHPPDLFSFGAPAAFRGYYWNWSRQLFRPTITAAKDQRNLWSWVILKAYTRNHSGTVRLRTDDPFACPDICFDSFNERAERIWDKLKEKKEESAATGKPSLPWIESLAGKIRHIRRDTERDVNGVLEGVRTMRQINSRNKQFVREIQPGPTLPEGSDELREWVKTQAWGHHASCTCRMGSDSWQADPSKLSDRFAVLDSRFRVHGVDKLRVVDASVFPGIPGYFILTPIFMISEKAADTLLEDAAAAVYPVKFEAMEAAAIRERRRKARLVPAGMAASANANACVPPKDEEETIAEKPGEPDEQKEGEGKIPRDTVGLALSGGGIRSATFALGFLQALAERNRLRNIDILSTVSGGGFTGSFLGRLFTRSNVTAATDPCGRVQDILKNTDSAPLWWLRTQANYIFATGMADLRKNLATYWRSVFTVHLVIGALLFAFFGLLRGIAPSLPGMLSAPAGLSLFGLKLSSWWWLPALSVALAVVPASLGFWLAPRTGIRTPYPFFPLLAWVVLLGGLAVALGWPGATLLAGAGLAIMIFAWFWQESARWKPPQGRQEGEGELHEGAVVRNRLTRSLGEMLFLFFGLLGWVVIDTFAQAVASMGIGATLAAVVLALGPVLPLLRSLAEKAIQQATETKGKKGFSLAVLANAIGIPLAIFLLFVLDLLAHELFLKRPEWAWGAVIIAALFSLALGRAIAFLNLSSLSATYAARLGRTFQGASNAARIYGDETDDARDVQLSHPEDDVPFHEYHPEAEGGPLHLINVCVNETVEQASERQVRERKGLPMSIGPHGVSVGRRYFAEWVRPTMGPRQKILSWCRGSEENSGDSATALRALPIVNNPNAFHVLGYRPEASEAEGCGEAARKTAPVESCSLGTWTAISGAAFNTGIGRGTTLPLAFFMGFINVRLGYWWDSGIPASKRPGRYPRPFWRWLKGIPAMLFRMQSMLLSEWRGLFHGPSRRFWYLSDGGHFEVTGLYELLRRRVAFMIVTDGGEDSDYDWNDLAQLIRAARMDFGAQIIWIEPPEDRAEDKGDWNLFATAMAATVADRRNRGVKVAVAEEIPPPWVREWINPSGVGTLREIRRKDSPRHAALARVTYDGSDAVSWILIVKPSLAPDLTEDILNYATSNEEFPQDPTIDQIFDDAQWESYRALGQQIGRKVLSK